jgi:hypothetical protein
VDARISPARFPVIQVGLGLFQALEAKALPWCFLCVPTPDSTFPFRSARPTRQGRGTVP